MSQVDMRTILVGGFATAVVGALVVTLLWMQYRRRFSGMGWWVVDFALQALGALLIAMRGSIPDWMSIVVANFLVMAGVLAGLLGLERFVGKRGPQLHNYVLLAAFVAVMAFFAFGRPDLTARTLNLSIMFLILCAQCAWLLLYRTPPSLRRISRGTALVFAAYCLVSVVRVGVTVAGPMSGNDFFAPGGFEKLVLMIYQALLLLLIFSLALMVTGRLRDEVRAQEEKFTKAFHSSPNAITLTRLSDGRILEVNEGFVEMTGHSYAESVGKTTLDLDIWPDEQVRGDILEELEGRRRVRAREAIFRKKSGELFAGSFSADITTVGDELCVLSSVDDITERRRWAETLRSNVERLGLALDVAKAGTWEWDLGSGSNVWSEEVWRLYGLEPDSCEPSHEAWLRTVHPDDRASVERIVREAVQAGAESTIEWRTREEHGPQRWLLSRGRPALDGEGKIAGYYGIVLDITDLKHAEAALRESERKFRDTVHNLDEAYYSVTLDGTLLDHNQAFNRILGFAHGEDLRGTHMPDFWMDPKARREYVAALMAAGAVANYRVDAKKQSGEVIAAIASAHLVKDESGRPLHIEGVVLDITRRVRAEEEIRRLNQDLEQRVLERTEALSDLYNNAPCGYHSLDEQGVFVRVNDTELSWLGYAREEVLGRLRFSDILTPASREVFARTFPVLKERGWVTDLEFDLVRKDGTIMPVLLSATAVKDSEGRFLLSRSTMIDYADRKEAEAALRRSRIRLEAVNKELEAFAYSVSHDLRAPLRAIEGFSRMILEDYGDSFDAEERRLFDAVRANTARMDRLITDLLALSRVARTETLTARLDMEALVRQVYAELAAAETESPAAFSVGSLPPAYGDETLIRQVWGNLLGNALKYTRNGSDRQIEVGAYVDDALTVYYVKDNGVGFDPRYARKLFGLFQRLHKASDFEGSGVGLAIVKRIITLHEGKVWAEGAPGQGATFYFGLPGEAGRQVV